MPNSAHLVVDGGIGVLRPDTDPADVEHGVATATRLRTLQFHEPLPDELLDAAAETLARHPQVALRVYGREVDPSLEWLARFEHVEHLGIDLWHVTSFDVLARFKRLRSLGLGETASKRPSLSFLRELGQLETLSIEAHDKDFDAVGELEALERLYLRVPRTKRLDALRGLERLEVFTMDFGGARDLAALADLPRLRGLALYQVRGLDSDDLAPLAGCRALEALSLGALRNVTRLPRTTARLLTLERLTGLETLADLAPSEQLEELGLYEARPADRRLDVLLECPRLNRLVVGDAYPAEQVDALRKGFRGDTLLIRGDTVKGSLDEVAVRWRTPVEAQLGL